MDEIWQQTLTHEDVEATYGTAQAATAAPRRGTISRISGHRTGAGDGVVTVEVYTDSDLEDLVCQAELTLSGDGSTDVAAPRHPLPWRSSDGPYVRIKDTADTGSDDIAITVSGERGRGA